MLGRDYTIKNWKLLILVVVLALTLPTAVSSETKEKPNISSFSPTSADRLSTFAMDIKGSGLSDPRYVVLSHKGCKAIYASDFTATDNEILANFTIPNETGKWTNEQQESRNENWCLVVPIHNTSNYYDMMCGFNIT